MIYAPSMVQTVNTFAGVSGNASQVGGAGSYVLNTGGGLVTQIYGRSIFPKHSGVITKRAPYNASNPFDYKWAGKPVTPGMPTPGTWTGFPATLAGVSIPISDAFLIGLIWIAVAFGMVAASVALFKGALETLAWMKRIKEDRLAYFRSHWMGYLAHTLLRTFFVAFAVVMTLAMLQFTIPASTAMLAITATIFALFLLGAVALVSLACYDRTRRGKFEMASDEIIFHRSSFVGIIPSWASTLKERQLEVRPIFAFSFPRLRHITNDTTRPTVHQDQTYLRLFGWFSGKYRQTRWWFLAYYIIYIVGRAGFLGTGLLSPLAQVYGLLVFEIFAFAVIIILNPFEGSRNTALAVWMLSISKIITTGLSIAFLPAFRLDRILATVVGVVIVVIQGLLVIAVMILIVLSTISTWMSLTRNREELGAELLEAIRIKYFEKMEAKASDTFQVPKPKKSKKGKGKDDEATEKPREPQFSVISVQRAPKIDDEDSDDDIVHDLEPLQHGTDASGLRSVSRASRANSVSSRRSVNSLPRGLRQQRTSSGSLKDHDTSTDDPDISIAGRLEDTSASDTPVEHVMRTSSRQSMRSLSGRPNSPFTPGLNTPSRETLARYAEERRYATPRPVIPDLKE